MDADDDLASGPHHCQRIIDLTRVFIVDRKSGGILVIDAAWPNAGHKLLCRFQEQLWKLRINPGQHQKPIHGRIDPAGGEQDGVRRFPSPCHARHFFQDRADLVAGPVFEPVLDAIQDWLCFGRNGDVLPIHELHDQIRGAFTRFFPLALPLPASPLGGDLFLRFGEKLRALALEEERILRKRAEYCRCRLSARFSKKHFRQLAGFHLALFSAEGFPE